MIYERAPADWKPQFEVASCFVECDEAILLLLRQWNKPEGDKWGAPAGKINEGETPEQALCREVEEETGLIVKEEMLSFVKKVYVRYPSYDFVYHMYKARVQKTPSNTTPDVRINEKEHGSFVWRTPRQAILMPLVTDMDACIKMVYPMMKA